MATIGQNDNNRPKWPHSAKLATIGKLAIFGQNGNNRPTWPQSDKMATIGQTGHIRPKRPQSAKLAIFGQNDNNRPKFMKLNACTNLRRSGLGVNFTTGGRG